MDYSVGNQGGTDYSAGNDLSYDSGAGQLEENRQRNVSSACPTGGHCRVCTRRCMNFG